ncbi:MAG: DUF4296 domain-containing protein [Ignavibacteriales bacterium]|nr:DUF4296 domain-containing protein [Ignavibacteriales bacterium]
MKSLISILLFSSFLFLTCSDEKVIMDEEKFASIYVDLLINQEKNRGDTSKVKLEQNKIFTKYQVNRKQYEATLEYYHKDPERWRDFFVKVNNYYNRIDKGSKSK